MYQHVYMDHPRCHHDTSYTLHSFISVCYLTPKPLALTIAQHHAYHLFLAPGALPQGNRFRRLV